MHFRTPHDVITYLLDNSPYRSMTRAMTEGKVEFLGGFYNVIPFNEGIINRPGWIIKVTSVYRRAWIMGVIPDEVSHSFRLVRLDEVPWKFKLPKNGNPLFDGIENGIRE